MGPSSSQGPNADVGARGDAGPEGPSGAIGPQGSQGDAGATGPSGAPKRIERYTAPANASSVATFTWSACTSTPDVDIIVGWVTLNGPTQMVIGAVTAQTLSGATTAVKISQGTLAIAASPFAAAPTGTNLTVRLIY